MSNICNKIKKERNTWIGILTLTLISIIMGGLHYEYKKSLKEKEPVVEIVRYQCICPMCHSKMYDFEQDKNMEVYSSDNLTNEVSYE